MPATISVSSSIDSALRKAFSEASVRLQPAALMSSLIAALESLGLTVSMQDGVLVLSQGSTTMHTVLALRELTRKPEFAQFFILSTDDPKTWTTAQKVEYVRKNGEEAYGKLCCTPVIEAGIKVLDPNMSRKDYEQLTRFERMNFIREYGDDAVRRIYQR
ncbi:MAG: hypothetical protein ABR880_20880 [Candidatus Sulfotelmatobacter sp.]|jgi:hypothetical protein